MGVFTETVSLRCVRLSATCKYVGGDVRMMECMDSGDLQTEHFLGK